MWYNICGGVILLIDILVCDDSAEIVEQVKKLLCAWEKVNTVSFNIDCRQSGKFILENKHKYDIAFIDIEMPEMSGLELAVELKKQNPDVLIIVLTSFQRYLDDAMRIHVFRYLSKPVDVNRFNKNLFDAVQESLDDVIIDVGFEQTCANGAQRLIDVGLVEFSDSAHALRDVAKSFGDRFKHNITLYNDWRVMRVGDEGLVWPSKMRAQY